MQSNLLSASEDGSYVRYPRSGRGGLIGYLRAWYVSAKENRTRKKSSLPPEPPYGIRMYVGLPGSGKTVSMVDYLLRCKETYPGIKIYSNFGFKYQDGEIKDIKDFLHYQNEKGIIFAVDEVQLSFQSRQYNAFPPEMIFLLTQNRKFRKHFVCTAQIYEHVDKVFRDLTNHVIDCHGYFNRVFFQKTWAGIDYKRTALISILETNTKPSKHLFKSSFYATQEIFDSYDTYKVVDAFVRQEDGKNDSPGNWRNRQQDPIPVYVPTSAK